MLKSSTSVFAVYTCATDIYSQSIQPFAKFKLSAWCSLAVFSARVNCEEVNCQATSKHL